MIPLRNCKIVGKPLMAIFDPYTHRTSLSAASFPLLLERARERRFKKPAMMSKQYIPPFA
jgi:hypothetical protein